MGEAQKAKLKWGVFLEFSKQGKDSSTYWVLSQHQAKGWPPCMPNVDPTHVL